MGANMLIRGSLTALFLLAGAALANAADLPVEPDLESVSYTYLTLEGGYIHFDGEEVQAFLLGSSTADLRPRFIDVTDGVYGRAEIGHVWSGGLGNGPISGVAAYVQGWQGEEDIGESGVDGTVSLGYHGESMTVVAAQTCPGNENCAARSDLERSLIEAGLRFFHDFGDAADLSGISLGIEPFVAFIQEDNDSVISSDALGTTFVVSRSSEFEATAVGALLSLDGRLHISQRTALTGRIAAGPYHMDAEADTLFLTSLPLGNDELSTDFFGLRGQLALGLDHAVTDGVSFGVIGRLDYWSDFPSIDWTNATFTTFPGDPNSIAEKDFLALSVGLRLTIMFGGATATP